MTEFRERVFRDPIYGYIHVSDEMIWNLIKTNEVQRLRRIKQLGGTHMVFHTAEHSRFSHSLGVYEMARKFISALNANQLVLTDHERLLTLCAALLHDLGHGPFSHSFESVTATHHEQFTRRILLEQTKVHDVLEAYQTNFSKEVSDVIEKKHPNPIITSLITSQLDADRLDYLQRDAYFTGASYGEIDVERILRTIRIVDDKVVYKVSGMHAIEDYLMSRYQMYWQVYLHGTGCSFSYIIQKMLYRVAMLATQGYTFKQYPSELLHLLLEKQPDISVFLKFDDTTLYYHAMCFLSEEDEILSDLARRFVNRELFKTVPLISTDCAEEKYTEIKTLLEQLEIDPFYYLILDRHKKNPYDYYESNKNPSDTIDILMLDQTVKEISEVSNVIKGILSIQAKEEAKLYVAKDLVLKLEPSEQKQKLLSLLQEHVQ